MCCCCLISTCSRDDVCRLSEEFRDQRLIKVLCSDAEYVTITWCSFLKKSESSDWNLSTNSSAVHDRKTHKIFLLFDLLCLWFLQVNFTRRDIVMCFDKFYDPRNEGDCIMGSSPDRRRAAFNIVQAESVLERWVKNKTQTIQNSLRCSVQIAMQISSSSVSPALHHKAWRVCLKLIVSINTENKHKMKNVLFIFYFLKGHCRLINMSMSDAAVQASFHLKGEGKPKMQRHLSVDRRQDQRMWMVKVMHNHNQTN